MTDAWSECLEIDEVVRVAALRNRESEPFTFSSSAAVLT